MEQLLQRLSLIHISKTVLFTVQKQVRLLSDVRKKGIITYVCAAQVRIAGA